ncbi:MmgE/PrpD family protein [Fodinicurvata sp. EGI_FJ10296]|uniref:MmgE/PrpD family protein n=1 Tax=Fodinicurvata sp. EGI_FJ10296 TaxID=3231908 RepID=UPI0034515921
MPDYTTTSALSAFAASPVVVGDDEWQWAAGMVAAMLASSGAGGAGAGSGSDAAITSTMDNLGGTGAEATVWAGGARRQAEWAAFANAFAVHGDLPPATGANTPDGMPIGTVVVPVALAVGELQNASAFQIVEAALVGAEAAIRVAEALGSTHPGRGWHLLGTAGVVGAAAAAARLMGLSPEQTEQCIGLGATQAAGLQAQQGYAAYSLHPAKASFNGIEAARLIFAGLDGPRAILEGRRGLFALASDDPDTASVTNGLGNEWRVRTNRAGGGRNSADDALLKQLADRQAAAKLAAAGLLVRH